MVGSDPFDAVPQPTPGVAAGALPFVSPFDYPRRMPRAVSVWPAHAPGLLQLSMSEPLSIAREARREHLRALLDFVADACARLGVDGDARSEIRLAVEEACMNLIEHGYPPGPPGPIELTIVGDAARVVVEIRDRAPPFDPASTRPPDLDAGWKERRVGGLGWHLINQVMDEVRYESDAAGNRLTLVKRRARGER